MTRKGSAPSFAPDPCSDPLDQGFLPPVGGPSDAVKAPNAAGTVLRYRLLPTVRHQSAARPPGSAIGGQCEAEFTTCHRPSRSPANTARVI